VEFSAPAYTSDETGASAGITATRIDGSGGAVSVWYAAAGGPATGGSDYTAISGTLAWNDGEDGARTFAVPVHDDDLYEPDETVNLTLADPTGGLKLGELSSAVLTIVDNNARPGTLQFSAAGYPVLETASSSLSSTRQSDFERWTRPCTPGARCRAVSCRLREIHPRRQTRRRLDLSVLG
jgi:hypothetical protein